MATSTTEIMDDIPIYKFLEGKWITADSLTERDVALLINKENKSIYIWDGKNSNPRTQIVAKDSLGDFKIEFPDYKFRLIKSLSTDRVPDFIINTLKLTIKDNKSVEAQIIENKFKLEKIVQIFGIFSIGLLLFILGRFLFVFNDNFSQPTGEEIQFFPSNSSFSNAMQVNAFLCMLVGIILIIKVILSIQLKMVERTMFFLIGLISLYLMLYLYWNPITSQIINGNSLSDPFIINDAFFFDYVLYSSIAIGIIIVSVVIALFLYKYKGKEENKNNF